MIPFKQAWNSNIPITDYQSMEQDVQYGGWHSHWPEGDGEQDVDVGPRLNRSLLVNISIEDKLYHGWQYIIWFLADRMIIRVTICDIVHNTRERLFDELKWSPIDTCVT